MGVLKRSEYLYYEIYSVLPFEAALLLDKFLESDAVDIFHDDELHLLGKSDIIYLYDIGM